MLLDTKRLEVDMDEQGTRSCEVPPKLLRRSVGGWLAISGPGARVRIAVEGMTPDEARARYDRELALWCTLLDKTPAEPI